jgi:integrase
MLCGMGRPKAQEGIRARSRSYDGIIEVHLEESPGHWIATPERDRTKAIAWAKRNRERLLNREAHDMAFYCRGLFDRESSWVRRMEKKGRHYTEKYLMNRRGYVDNYIVPAFGRSSPKDINRREIDNWLLDLKKTNGRELAGETKNKIMYTLSIIFEELLDTGIVEVNPVIGIRPYDKTPVKPRGTIDRESLDKLYPASRGEMMRVWGSSMWAAMMLVFNDTGSRSGEVRALTWADINIQKKFIPIRKGIESGTVDTVKGTKTGAAKAGFLTLRTVQELDIWRSESRFSADDDFIFTASGKAPVTNESVIKAFHRGLAAAGITGKSWTPYALMGNGVTVLRRHYLHPDDTTLCINPTPTFRKNSTRPGASLEHRLPPD